MQAHDEGLGITSPTHLWLTVAMDPTLGEQTHNRVQ